MAFYLGKDKQKITISEAMLGGGTTRPVETKEVAYNKNGTYEIKPTSGYVMSKIDVTVEVPPKEEQSKSKDITENGTYTITPDKNKVLSEAKVNVDVQPVVEPLFVNTNNTYTPPSGVDGFSSVEVNVPSRYNDGVEDGKEIGRSEGYAEGYEVGYQYGLEVNNFNVATLQVTENNTTYLPEDYGLDGFGSVEVKVPINLYAETITENNKTYMPKEDFDGFSEIIVKVPERYDEGLEDGKVIGREEGYADGKVDGKAEGYQEGRDSIKLYDATISESGTYTVNPEIGFDGFSLINVNVSDRYQDGFEAGFEDGKADGIAEGVASIKIQSEKEAKENGTVEPDEGFDGLAKVIVAVPQKTEVDLEETITENNKTFTYEPEDGETFKKVIINVNVPTEIEGEFNGVALLEEGNLVGEKVYYHIYDNGWAIIDGIGGISDCEGYNDDPFGLGQNMNPPSPFWNHSSITHVYIADGITHIGAGLFADCSNIEELRLPDSLTHIGTCAFENTSITKIYIPESVTTIEENAFLPCPNLTDVYYGGTKLEWDEHEHNGFFMSGLENQTIHCKYEVPEDIQGEFNGIALLEEGAFDSGEAFYHIYDNGWVIIDGEGDVEYTTEFEHIKSPFDGCDSITHVYVADGITGIGQSLFEDHTNIEEVRLPDTLTYIGVDAFYNTNISTIYIPSSVTYLGAGAFSATLLSEIYYGGTNSEWENLRGWDEIGGALWTATLHCEYEEPTGNDTPELTTEIWEFEMEDGSIVTKEVVVV